MATTFTDITGNNQASREFSFPSYKVGDIKVEVDGITYDNRTISGANASTTTFTISGYSTTGGGNVVFDTAPTSDPLQLIRIYRDTDVDTAKATYTAGSSVKAADLNNNMTQLLYAAQEEQNQTIIASDIKDGVITSAKILDGTIVNADINASAAIAGTKISPAFGSQNISLTGNITVSGTVDGRDVSTDGTKLDGIESNATADQTAAEIRTLVGNANDSNVFTDADHSKLDNIEASATADQTASEIRTLVENANDSNVFTDADHSKLNGIEAGATGDQTNNEIRNAVEAATDSNTFTDADHSKLDGIEAGATADQTNAEIRAAVEAASDSNVFTDADHSKLNVIEAGATADQTAAEIRVLIDDASDSNVFTDADHTKLNGIETGATADQTNAEIRAAVEAATDSNVFTDADHTKLNNAATLTDAQTLTNKTLTTPVINDFSGTAIVTSGTSTSDNKVYSAKRSDELYTTGATQAAASASAAQISANVASSQATNSATNATSAATSAINSATSATTATTQATNAATQATAALNNLNEFKGIYLGDLSSNPTTDALGNAVNEGDLYFNTVQKRLRIYNGAAWAGINEGALELSKIATTDFSAVYTASAGSNSINLGGLAISGAAFSNEQIATNRMSLAKGSATYNLGGI